MSAESREGLRAYADHLNRKRVALAVMFLVLFVICLASLIIGSRIGDSYLSVSEVFHGIIGDGSSKAVILMGVRFPELLAGVLIGAALGIAGAVMQCVLKNPLASPYTLGISNAAAFGASIGILLLNGGIITQSTLVPQINNPYTVAIMAFAWSMIGTAIIILIVKITGATPATMVLAGVAISSIFSAGVAFLQYTATDGQLSALVFWQFGSLSKVSGNMIPLIAAVVIAISLMFLYLRWDYNATEGGDEVARGLGINVNRLRIYTLLGAAVITAICVSFAGVIGFIGLAAPHMVRKVVGDDHRFLLTGSMIMGAMILVLADTIAQNAFTSTFGVLPVGIITSFLGGPLFLYILLRGYKKNAGSL
ncbi:MAG: iron ABC transporter permease [Candidatus Methanomethylophilaceae archaeon]